MTEKESDSLDARVTTNSIGEPVSSARLGLLNIPVDSLVYNFQHKQRGKCLVFNHQYFDKSTGCRPRPGTEIDANSIIKCFYDLEFNILQFNDAPHRDIRDALSKVSTEDHSDRDCIVIVVLSHGDEVSLWARDAKYPIDMLFNYFKGDRCPTLAGKPKIFIIQACRGDKTDSGTKVMGIGMDVVDAPQQPVYRIPTIADFLIYYSTAPGYYSFRNTANGSYFIQALVYVLNKYCHKYQVDLLTLLTFVNQRVAYGFESYVPDNSNYHQKKQIPCIASMLTRLVFFTAKPLRNKLIETVI